MIAIQLHLFDTTKFDFVRGDKASNMCCPVCGLEAPAWAFPDGLMRGIMCTKCDKGRLILGLQLC